MKTILAGIVLCSVGLLIAGCSAGAPQPTATPAPPSPTPYGDRLTPVEAVASSETAYVASYAIDGFMRTRWRPEGTETEWLYVDLGDAYRVTRVTVHWHPGVELSGAAGGNRHAVDYEVQVSDDAETWTTVRSIVGGDGGADDFTGLDVTGRYVRVYCTEPSRYSGGPDEYDIWELEIYGEAPSE
jgi:hypothetical protein